eukprot:2940394-Prymnesium_polylepis.1
MRSALTARVSGTRARRRSQTLSVPKHVTAATGIDAMVHCTEAYTSAVKKNLLSDVLAREGLRLLGTNIRK